MASTTTLQSQAFSAGTFTTSTNDPSFSDAQPYNATKFDPDKHMCYTPPSKTITLAEINLNPPQATSPVAITTPFQLITEEGIRELRADIFRREIVAKYGSLKYPGVYRIRGYGAEAPFTYALWRSEEMRRVCSAAAGTELEIIFDYEIGQLNVQLAESVDRDAPIADVLPPAVPPRPEVSQDESAEPDEISKNLVSAWHIDSYPWVCVLMLSDPVGMKGGETALRTGDGSILKVKPPGMGYAVMMQGGSINHAALPCLGKGERITFVTSFRPKDPTLPDMSSLRTVRPISNVDELFKQWTTYRMEILSKRAALMKKELDVNGRTVDDIKSLLGPWVEDQIAYLRNTMEEMM